MSEAQMILYRVLVTGADLANRAGDTTGLSAKWTAQAHDLRTAILTNFWDADYGAFKNYPTNTKKMYPQDANSLAIMFGVVEANSSEAQSISARLTDNWTPIGAVPPEFPGDISPFDSSFEIQAQPVQAHLIAGQAQRGLELIRRSWGCDLISNILYLNHPNGTGSTVIEGNLKNGEFGYTNYGNVSISGRVVSHAHGWGSGPTSALAQYIVGLSVTGPVGSTFRFAPQFGDLSRAEGGFTTKLGKFQASWIKESNGLYNTTYSTPPGTHGELILPVVRKGVKPRVVLDGKVVVHPEWSTRKELAFESVRIHAKSGDHTIVVS